MQELTRRRRPLLKGSAALVAAGALVTMLATVSGANVSPRTFPAYPSSLTSADIKLAAKYIGGTANKKATGSAITIGFINDESGTAPTYPENEQGATVAQDLVNNDLGGIKGHKLAFNFCNANTVAEADSCATSMVAAHVKLVLTGTLVVSADKQMYQTLFAAKIPVIQGNDLTTDDFSAPSYGGTAVTYMPGSPGVVLGMAKFIGTLGLGGSSVPSTIDGFYLQGDTGSQTACLLLFKTSAYLKHSTVNCQAIPQPWSTANFESVLAGDSSSAVYVPLLPVAQCISFDQATTALSQKNTVVTSGLCFGKQLKQTLGTYPNGWYFGDYGINYFMYDSALATSQQLAVYIAAVDKFSPSIDYTGFAGPSFGTVLTAVKLYNANGGPTATSAKLATAAQKFKGPQWGISGPMTCGKINGLFPSLCGKYIGIAQFLSGSWKPIQDAYNNKLIDPFD
jgi:branched-chain amino acid transport system substrate-binding protein